MRTMSDFRQRVLAAREYGVVHCEFRRREELGSSGDARQVADDLVRIVGFRTLGTKWRELTPESACAALERVLGRDLAYGVQAMSSSTAQELSREFITLFSGRSFFYTNGDFPPPEEYREGGWAGSWDPVTRATFDTGVVAVGGDHTGLLWIEDED
jgi:hypothetical protein